MALLSFILALLESHQSRAHTRFNANAVAHLNDSQLRDIGLYRVDGHVRPIDDPLALAAELKVKQEAAIKALVDMRDKETQTTGRSINSLPNKVDQTNGKM